MSNRMGAAGVGLPLPQVYANLYSNEWSLGAGRTRIIPSGSYLVQPGPYTFIQFKDPVSGLWRNMGTWGVQARIVQSDGVNFRLANLTGCMVGALITNKGSGYTSAPTVTPSAGSPALTAILSPSLDSVTITSAGSGYTYPPILVVDPPPSGGIQATAIATIAAGAVNAVTVVNEGAGYSAGIPTIRVIQDSRDTGTPVAAVLTGVLTAAGTVKAVVVTDPGAPQTAVATLAFAGGGGSSAAATAIYCFAVTDFTVGAGGAAYGNAQPVLVHGYGGIVAGTAANANPAIEKGIFQVRPPMINAFSDAGGAVITTNEVVTDGGLSQAVPLLAVIAGGSGLATTVAQLTATVGGVTDTSWVQPT